MKVKLRKAPIGHASRKELPQATRLDGAQRMNFFEDNAPQWIVKNSGLEQPANFQARAGFEQHGTKKAKRVALEFESAVGFLAAV